jgi:Transposase DDE domain
VPTRGGDLAVRPWRSPSRQPRPGRTATPRCGVEGTIAQAQAARRSDLHHARYRGLAKTHLQHVLTALALNLVRVDTWLTGIPLGGSWASRLPRPQPPPSPV